MTFELCERGGHNSLDVARLTHVRFDQDYFDLWPDLSNLIANSVEFIDMSRHERQPCRTFARKSQRHFAAKTLRGAGNENVLTLEFSHSMKLLLLFALRHTAISRQSPILPAYTDPKGIWTINSNECRGSMSAPLSLESVSLALSSRQQNFEI